MAQGSRACTPVELRENSLQISLASEFCLLVDALIKETSARPMQCDPMNNTKSVRIHFTVFKSILIDIAEEMQRVMQEELYREHVRRQYEQGKSDIVNTALTE